MTDSERYTEKRYGIEMAAAYRVAKTEPESKKWGTAREDIILEWEQSCMKILGREGYQKSRQERYGVVIDQMRKEAADVSA